MIEGTLRAYYFQLRLSVEDYEFPHFTTGRDGNALACQVVVEDTEIGDSYLRHSPTLYNFELASFTEQLRTLERDGSGQAILGDTDPESGDELGLTISLSDGTGTLAGFIGNKAGARLGFGPIDINRSFLADALASSTTSSRPSPFAATSPPTEPHHHQRVNPRPALRRPRWIVATTPLSGQPEHPRVATLSRSSTRSRTHTLRG